MSDKTPFNETSDPVTIDSMVRDFRALGLETGQTILVHASLSTLGWVCGGPEAVVDALQRVIGHTGTLVMPTHTPGNRDPADMKSPPVPESWYEAIRAQMPPYREEITPTSGMGAIPECFRSYPDVLRSQHPQHSFAAWGKEAQFVTEDHSFEYSFGEESPLARVYDCGGKILLLGTSHKVNTSLHLAEYRADLGLDPTTNASAAIVDGERQWISFEDIPITDADFDDCGTAYEAATSANFVRGDIGEAEATLISQPSIVDFATDWFEANRS